MGARIVTRTAAFAAAALAVWAGGVRAQDLSDAEITARFQAQIAAARAAEEDPALGAARSLRQIVIAPAGAPGEAPEEAAVSVEGADDGLAPLTPPQTAAAGEAAMPVTYLPLDKDEQVNVQVTFAFDSAALAESQKAKLRQICGVLDGAGVGVLRIVGHTDASGPTAYNQQLSVLRAQEVQRFFVGDCGVAADRLEAIGVGEQFPFDAGNPSASVNRRVEFQAMG